MERQGARGNRSTPFTSSNKVSHGKSHQPLANGLLPTSTLNKERHCIHTQLCSIVGYKVLTVNTVFGVLTNNPPFSSQKSVLFIIQTARIALNLTKHAQSPCKRGASVHQKEVVIEKLPQGADLRDYIITDIWPGHLQYFPPSHFPALMGVKLRIWALDKVGELVGILLTLPEAGLPVCIPLFLTRLTELTI